MKEEFDMPKPEIIKLNGILYKQFGHLHKIARAFVDRLVKGSMLKVSDTDGILNLKKCVNAKKKAYDGMRLYQGTKQNLGADGWIAFRI